MGIFSDFYDAASEKVSSVADTYLARPSTTDQSIGGSIFEALYQYGAGRTVAARETLVAGALATAQGQKFVAEAERQRLQFYMPYIIGGGLLLGGAFFLMRR